MHVAIEVNGNWYTQTNNLKQAREWKAYAIEKGSIKATDVCTYHKWVYDSNGDCIGYDKNGRVF